MLKDLKPRGYRHPNTVWLDADSRPLLVRLREKVPVGTHWKTAFEGLAEEVHRHQAHRQ